MAVDPSSKRTLLTESLLEILPLFFIADEGGVYECLFLLTMVFFVSMIKKTNNPITIMSKTTTTMRGTIGLIYPFFTFNCSSHVPSIYISVCIS